MSGKPSDLITVAATVDIITSSSFGIGIATSSSADTAGGCTCRLVVVASSTACKLEPSVTTAIETIDWAVVGELGQGLVWRSDPSFCVARYYHS